MLSPQVMHKQVSLSVYNRKTIDFMIEMRYNLHKGACIM
jgi:hypothetical protein